MSHGLLSLLDSACAKETNGLSPSRRGTENGRDADGFESHADDADNADVRYANGCALLRAVG